MVHSLTVVLAAVAVLMAGAKTHGHMKAFRHGLEVQVRAAQTNNAVKDALIKNYEVKENIPSATVPICPETLKEFAKSLGANREDVLQVKNFKLKQQTTACREASFAAMALTVLDTETFEAFAKTDHNNNFPTEDELASIGECNFAILNGKFSADANSDQNSWKVVQCEKARFDTKLVKSLETHLEIELTTKQKGKLTFCKNMQNYNDKKYKYDIGSAKKEKICASPDVASSAGGYAAVADAMKKKLQLSAVVDEDEDEHWELHKEDVVDQAFVKSAVMAEDEIHYLPYDMEDVVDQDDPSYDTPHSIQI